MCQRDLYLPMYLVEQPLQRKATEFPFCHYWNTCWNVFRLTVKYLWARILLEKYRGTITHILGEGKQMA